MNVVAEWSLLEGFINGLFATLLGGDDGRATAIFSTIRSQQGQRDAINAAVNLSLQDQDERDIVTAVMSVYEKASKTRNKIAHWVWGHSSNLPEAVLLADPVAMAAFQAEIIAFTQNVRSGAKLQERPQLDKSRIFAYFANDFDDASKRIQRSIGLTARARNALSARTDSGAQELLQLSSEPEIRTELERLNKGRQNDLEAH